MLCLHNMRLAAGYVTLVVLRGIMQPHEWPRKLYGPPCDLW